MNKAGVVSAFMEWTLKRTRALIKCSPSDGGQSYESIDKNQATEPKRESTGTASQRRWHSCGSLKD